MIINHNMPALNGHRNLGMSNVLAGKVQEKLSSGLRINRAADDAAGLAISETMRAQIRGLNQATRNSQDAVSLIQTAEGALTEVHSMLDRMRELAVQAANDSYTSNDRVELQKEVDQLKSEIDRIANTTSFNNKYLLDGSASALVSADLGTTSVFVRGNINTYAAAGGAAAGTYKVNIVNSGTGSAQTQISNIMMDRATGSVATAGQQLVSVANFYDASGKFILDNDRLVTLIEGDGKTGSFTISSKDTLAVLATKFNSAIMYNTGLNQVAINGVSASVTQYAGQFVSTTMVASGGLSTQGVFLLSSSKASDDGAINVVADQDIVSAFGFSQVRAAVDTTYTVNITNSITGAAIVTNLNVKGNNILGQLNRNVDIQFDPNAAISFNNYNLVSGYMSVVSSTVGSVNTYIHLVDNSQTFQIGANELQNMDAAVGNMRTEALGVDNILITDIPNAGKAITKIDMAISRVSSQRSSLGAVQNRLEHTINNLGVASENIQAAESRIRDADMAKEMMEFTRLQILSQASTAMLAQANQQPQQVLQLLGR